MKIDRYQNMTTDDLPFGYIHIGRGGLFFVWRYNPAAKERDQIRQVCDTIEPDTIDPPTGRWSYRGVERALRTHIHRHGLVRAVA